MDTNCGWHRMTNDDDVNDDDNGVENNHNCDRMFV